MSSTYLRNNGDGTFSSGDLLSACQAGPVKAFYVGDINGDTFLDFIYAGNHLATEIETARYDGLYPGVCLGDGKGNFTCNTALIDGKFRIEDARDIQQIKLADGRQVYLIANNNGGMRVCSLSN
ncbi:MAG: hypothetical protein IPL92_04525 [Saprospiraceae bacterium]|nr:hypothetical protein [Candidatus Opimibacter iunctus]